MLLAACNNTVERNADRLMSDLYEQGGFTGAVVIAKEGKVVYGRGFGMADDTRPFAPDTAAESGSLAKPVTATAILLLASEGKVDLDAPARSYVAEFPYPDVTVRHLLSHSAGLPNYDVFEDLIADGAPTDNLSLLKATALRRPQPAFAPGTAFDYCNLCYDALASIIERVSGRRYAEFIAERLFTPAGMTDTFVRPARLADWPGPRALGRKIRGDRVQPNDVFDNEGFYGGGNVNFSARDLARWMTLWASGSGAIPESVRKAAVEPAKIGDALSPLTLGSWYCAKGAAACYYTGHHQGFHALAYWNAETRVAVSFIASNTLTSPLEPALARALVAAAEARKAERLVFDATREASEATIARIAGDYAGAGIEPFSIVDDQGRAFLEIAGQPRQQLFPIGYDGLYAPGADVYFFVDPATNGITWSTIFLETSARRK